MLGPQSLVLFALLLVLFGVLIWWLIVSKHLVLQIVAAGLAFVMAMAFGVLSVNRYFGYYATWGAAIADFSNQSPNSGPQISQGSLLSGSKNSTFNQHAVYVRLALEQGYTLKVDMAGKLSHINRVGYVYLPPQYFEAQYANYRFPVIELIHGQPGVPQDWINVVGVQETLTDLIKHGEASPVVLVMPDANGGNRISLQCLNQVGGPADLTYLTQDVPDVIAHMLRVQSPGTGWGVAGYSEGGYCAANMALRYRYRYGFAASMSGYFNPYKNKLADGKSVSPFGSDSALRTENTPTDEVQSLASGARLPQFWLGAGASDRADVANAEYFSQELQLHEAGVPLILTAGGGHSMGTWHAEVPPMLTWMTRGLAGVVAHTDQLQLARARAEAHADHKAGADPPAQRGPTSSARPTPSASSSG
ncbi:MAG: alpha/beta hydrolase [Streptosporangiaceae bacterium]